MPVTFCDHPDFPAAVALAGRLADVAREISLKHFRTPLDVERKGDGSPVTIADRGIETKMREMIRAAFPSHAIRGEEFAAEGSGEFAWVLDPIDGTKSFVTGFPLFGSLIALTQGGRPVLGVIEAPVLAERWVRLRGTGNDIQRACRPGERLPRSGARGHLHDHRGDL